MLRRKRAFYLASLVAVVAVVLAAGVATATAGGGNSANAKKCQKGGWQHLTTSTGESFANEGACVSYGARGGTLSTPNTKAQHDCESLQGTYSPPSGDMRFVCTRYVVSSPEAGAAAGELLTADCVASGGNGSGTFLDPGNQSGGYPLTYTTECL
jgi:hypothetical protein